jgi:addiction module antitoxin, relB/dinJ family
MAKTANINLRIEPSTKAQAEELFSSFGITVTDAINIFLRISIMESGFPFQIKQPHYNHQTDLAIQEARDIMNGKVQPKVYPSVDELFEDN